jgi:O-antigen/teichoic acid export membrane protein
MNSIKKNFIYQAFYEILVVIMPLLTSPYVSRVLGASNIGTYSYTYTIASYFVLFSALGIKNYGNREISRNRDDKKSLNETFSGILFLHFIVSGIVVIAYAIYVAFIVSPEYRLYSIIQGLYVVTAFFDISWLFFGLEKFKVTVTRNSAIKILSAVAIFLFVNKSDDLWKYVTILAVANFLGQAYLWIYAGKYVKICKVTKQQIFCHLPQMLVLFIPTIAISLYNYMDKIMVGIISNKTQLGFYENSEKIIFIATSVIGSVGTVMLPRMSNMAARGEVEKGKRYIADSMQVVICMSCAMAFGIVGISEVFAPIFWGKEFSECAVLIALLSIVLPIKGFANVLRTQYLIPNKMDKAYTISVCTGAVVNLIANFILIPLISAAGAVVGTIIAELSVCLVQMYYCSKPLPLGSYLKSGAVYFLFGAVMCVIIRQMGVLMGLHVYTIVVQVVTGVVLFGAMCLVYFIRTKNRLFFDSFNNLKKKFKKQ